MNAHSDIDYIKSACIILATALLLRLAWAALIPVVPVADSQAYDQLARTLANHGIYGWAADRPSAFWPVGTSALYAALYKIFGLSFTPIISLNIALSTAIVGLTMSLGRTLFDDATSIVAGGLLAVWPAEVCYVTILSSELPFTFCVMLGLVAWFGTGRSTVNLALTSGLAFGAATYFRPVSLLLPGVLWLSAFPNWKTLYSRLPMAVLATTVILVTIAPWSVRNTKLYGDVVMFTTSAGVNLWMGNNPKATGLYLPVPEWVRDMSEYEQHKALGEKARKYIIEDPVAFVLRSVKKALLLHIKETAAVSWNYEGIKSLFGESAMLPLKIVHQGYWIAMLLLAVIGVIQMMQARGIIPTFAHPAVLTWAYFTAVYAAIVIGDRYHFPSHPLIALLAAIGTLGIVGRIHWAKIRSRP